MSIVYVVIGLFIGILIGFGIGYVCCAYHNKTNHYGVKKNKRMKL